MIPSFLAGRPVLRRALFLVAVVLLTLVFTQLLLPGRGNDPRGTPAAILFGGLVTGMVTALAAAGIVLIYRTSRIINFAQTAIGAAGATLMFEMVQYTPIPFPIAFLLGLVLAGLLGVAFDLIVGRRFFNAPRLVLTVFTIILAQFIGTSASDLIRRLPIFPELSERSIAQFINIEDLTRSLPFPGWEFEVGGLPLKYGFSEVFAIEASILALALLAAFLRFTRIGVAVRAMAENPERATLLGISVGLMSSVVWGMAGVLSGAGVALNGMVTTPLNAAGFAPKVLLVALTAAVLGRMRNLPTTVFMTVVLSIIVAACEWSVPNDTGLVYLGLLLLVLGGLFFQRRQAGRSEGATAAWEAVEEQRPIPKELLAVGGIRVARIAASVIGLVALGLYPFVVSTGATNLGGIIALQAVIAISLVVLTGWAGQVSLGQFGFAAVGAVVAGSLTGRAGFPFWVAVPLSAVAAGAVAVLVGLPALRIRGLFLLVTTYGFALTAASTLFNRRYFRWMLPEEVERPSLFFLDFEDERSMYFLCVATLVLTIVVVTNLRKSRFGRLLIALRENEANLQSFGVSATRMKLAAFAVSGGMAGIAGAVFVHQQRGLSVESFSAANSIGIFILAVIGGIGSIGGAILGSAYFNAINYFFSSNLLVAFLGPLATIFLLYISPGGMMAVLMQLRDGVLRIVAQRRQIIVPSLFADYDPAALERQLIQLSEPVPGAGLGALPAGRRFAMASELYQGRGERIIEKLTASAPTAEAAAIEAAATSVDEQEVTTVGQGVMP